MLSKTVTAMSYKTSIDRNDREILINSNHYALIILNVFLVYNINAYKLRDLRILVVNIQAFTNKN